MMRGDTQDTLNVLDDSQGEETRLHKDTDNQKSNSCDLFDGNREARALAINHVAQGFFLIGGVYISTAILGLAYSVGDCATLPADCRIWGLKPSSLLSTMTSISSFFSALCMPFIGAIVDHTDYRRCIAFCAGMFAVGLNFIEIFVSEKTFYVVIICHIITPVVSLLHQMSIFAYFYELTDKGNTLTKYLSIFQGIRQISMLTCVLVVLLLANVWPGITPGTVEELVVTARIAQVFITTVSFISMILTFYKGIESRKATSKVPEGGSIFTLGFVQLYGTLKRITKSLPAVKWYLVACAFYGSLLGSTVAIAITYLRFYLGFGLHKIAISTIVYLVASVFGASIVPILSSKIGLFRSLQFVVFCIMVVWGFIGLLAGPEHGNYFFIYAFLWGFFAGMIIPTGRALFLRITPRGQETELMGIFLLFINGFVWVPPLIMTLINEAGMSFRYIMPILGSFDLFALIALFNMGDFDKAREAADKISIERSSITFANHDMEGDAGEMQSYSTPIDDKSTDVHNGKNVATIAKYSSTTDVSQDVPAGDNENGHGNC